MTTLLVDGPNLTMRSLHAAMRSRTAMTTSDGVDTGALTIFINTLGALVREEGPTRFGIAWDSPERGFRYTVHEGYKAHRAEAPMQDAKESTFELVRQFCHLAGLQSVTVPALEADDVIASWWHTTGPDGGSIVIASADHDFLQLAGFNPHGVDTRIYRFDNGAPWNAYRVAELYDSPEHYPLIAALAGDVSDNIPGIRGIGPKKAIKLLTRHSWDLESALDEHPDERDRVRTYFCMINLRDTVHPMCPIPHSIPAGGPSGALIEFLEHYEMKSALAKLRAGTLWRAIPYRR